MLSEINTRGEAKRFPSFFPDPSFSYDCPAASVVTVTASPVGVSP